ncbi:MAG: ABC transporter permease [Chlamydiia bacterium]|nr:ABC transporter permease [Chlamydiia bacterium]
MSLRRIRGVFFRYYYTLLKGPHQLADLFYWPLVDILIWGLTSAWLQNQSQVSNLPLVMMTALIFWQIAWRGSVDISVNLLQEFWHRNLVNLFSTPLKVSEWAVGLIMLSTCKLFATVGFGSLMVYLLYSLNVYEVGWMFLPFAALVIIFGWSLGFFAAGMIIYYGQQLEMFAWMVAFLFAPFSAVFYPLDVLPVWAQWVAKGIPTSYVFEGMRTVLRGGELPVWNLLMSLTLDIVYLALAVAFFTAMYSKRRRKGLMHLE